VPRFVTPTPAQVRSILAESHGLWGAGLSAADYLGMWEELAESRWGRSWYSWRAVVDDGDRVLSSLKLYRPLLRIGEEEGRVAAIGAVFTPRPLRRAGHAAAVIRATLDEAEARGDRTALLFTDIGIDYYRAFGFTPLPCEDALGVLPHDMRAKGRLTLRGMTADDLDAVTAAHAAAAGRRRIAIVRDRDHWEFLLLRAASFFRRLDRSDLARRFMIAMDGARAVGYLVAVMGPGEWNLREAESFDGDPETLRRILAAGAADAREDGASTVWGWLPRDVWSLVPSWRLRSQPRLRAIPMLRPLGGRALGAAVDSVDAAYMPYLDQF
jgi:hypothetical protein